MSILKKIILAIIFLFPTQNSFAAMITQLDSQIFQDASDNMHENMGGIEFNNDGTKMFLSYMNTTNYNVGDDDYIAEYTLSTPYDISTATYAGDSERCNTADPNHDGTVLGDNNTTAMIIAFRFSNDGKIVFTAQRGFNAPPGNSFVNRYDLTIPFDVSTCTYVSDVDVDTAALQDGTNAGARLSTNDRNNLQGIEITNDGTKMFLSINDGNAGKNYANIKQYNFGTPYDLSTITLASTAIVLANNNPFGLTFSKDGKMLFQAFRGNSTVVQYSLGNAFDLSSSSKVGEFDLSALDTNLNDLVGLTFSSSGTKLFATNRNVERVFEYKLNCPFNIIAGNCPSITSDPDRAGIAEAQIETAKRAINLSTNSALNRLKWIRRNKDKENLTNQNAKLNFSRTMLTKLNPLPISSFKKISNHKLNKNDNKNYFHWSEGDISLGRIGETSTTSRKENLTNSITYGVDRFKDDKGVEGFAIRYGLEDIDVGNVGSNLDSRTYNITYYNTSPMKNDTKYVDKIFGIGRIESDILTKLDGSNVTADRTGHQIYGTLKIKDEYKKNNLTFIPSGQIDLGHTKLDGYQEVGSGAIRVQDHHITTQNLRAAFALVDDLSTDKYTFKRHGKLEYLADTDRSSSFKYNYVSDSSSVLIDNLKTGALHNLNFEIGIDIIFPERFSLFAIYERNQTLDNGYSGHTDNLYLAIGYLPNKNNEYTFLLNGSENLVSNFEIKKNIKGYKISFNLAENLMKLGEASDASIIINKVF